jgi:hypothetical protein
MTNVVCILHGGCPIPGWLEDAACAGRLYLTLNDPGEHDYDAVPAAALVSRNPVPRGFAENVNAALHKVFVEDDQEMACVVNFDLEMDADVPFILAGALAAHADLGAVAAALLAPGDAPTFSVGTRPTPFKEFLRASGLRSEALVAVQRRLLRRTDGWSTRNTAPSEELRLLSAEEYLPWTCLALRRQAWVDVGPLDERFPLYGEDIDWGFRCHRSRWRLGLADCGPVVHFGRATRGQRADSLYEVSHRELHRKWGWDSSFRWQQQGLRWRRRWPFRRWTAPLDWSLLTPHIHRRESDLGVDHV